MAQSMLNAITEAESRCNARETEALESARRLAEKAEIDAKAIIDDAEKEAAAAADRKIAEAKTAYEDLVKKRIAEAETECEKISAAADKNRKAVVQSVIAELTR